MITLRINNTSPHPLPKYQTAGAAGFDITANVPHDITLAPLESAPIPTGLFIAIPPGYEAQIRPRSGLAYKHGVTLINAPGTIDCDYRGEWNVLLINLSKVPYTIHDGDRIAQVVVSACEQVQFEAVTTLDETSRGQGGLGHTGV